MEPAPKADSAEREVWDALANGDCARVEALTRDLESEPARLRLELARVAALKLSGV